ncbi:MAG: hypothetical protein ABW152_17885 [Candidatus Thiodiazotropha endolucinida]
MWKRFGHDPKTDAERLQLKPGDGIARGLFARLLDGGDVHADELKPQSMPYLYEQRLVLVSIDSDTFTAKDPSGNEYTCSWHEATAYDDQSCEHIEPVNVEFLYTQHAEISKAFDLIQSAYYSACALQQNMDYLALALTSVRKALNHLDGKLREAESAR